MKKRHFLLAGITCCLFACSLQAQIKVLGIAGSTREGSFNKMLLKQGLNDAKQQGAETTFVDLEKYPMPFFDEDLERDEGMPANAKKLRRLMMDHQFIVIASPEYNGSLPAVLKNALDWASRSEDARFSTEAFKGKTFALLSASPGSGGGCRGLAHLSNVLQSLGAKVLSKQTCICEAYSAFNSDGTLKDEEQRKKVLMEMQLLLSHAKH